MLSKSLELGVRITFFSLEFLLPKYYIAAGEKDVKTLGEVTASRNRII